MVHDLHCNPWYPTTSERSWMRYSVLTASVAGYVVCSSGVPNASRSAVSKVSPFSAIPGGSL